MSKFGGGGSKCVICEKTAYPAETISFEKKAYHVDCFRCSDCNKKMEGAAKAQEFEDKLYCQPCFSKNGFAQKQKKVVWTKKEGTGSGSASKFGGGGNPCTICAKTVYPAETLKFEKKVYHQACFNCMKCTKRMTPSDAAAFEDEVMCRKCFADGGYSRKQAKTTSSAGSSKANALAARFGGGGNKCVICTKTVYSAEQVSFEKKAYHADCFKCSLCEKKMTPASAAQFDDQIMCTKCFKDNGYNRKQTQTSGSSSSKANSIASKFGGGGNKCVRCTKTVYPAETVSYEKNFFHSACFTCQEETCAKLLTPSTAEGKKNEDGSVDVYCKKCWVEKGLNRAQVN